MTVLQPVRVGELPRSIEEFIALRDQVAVTPQGGAATMIVALLLYAEDKDLGQQCLTAAIDRERLDASQGPEGYEGWRLRKSDMQLIRLQIEKQAYVPRSYVQGATPENGYQLPTPPYVFEFSDTPYSGDVDAGTYKVFVACSGAASPRPVTVRRNNQGIWKASEWSSLVVGVKAPTREVDDDV